MGAVQLNTRLDEDIKRAGDAVLAEYGVSSTEAIRSLWQYMEREHVLPDFIVTNTFAQHAYLQEAQQNAGIALRLAKELGMNITTIQRMDYSDLREAAYEELLLEREEGIA